jgi:hypothetical protein
MLICSLLVAGRVACGLRSNLGLELTLNRSLRGLNSKRSNLEFQMRRVSLAITVYLIWEERNKRVFDGKSRGVDTVFRSFQILFYIVFRFHEKDHLQLAVG